ncbi:unnamed protein product [Symbiodinium necroappetens]|uniref:Uncharacterized protein n=1 Tax=Symbiodinium necroappetens TaxID=1628268 RepID=A0A812PL59_9DINO|nr:unnamed protein product [Symbiodinium necroappetens]
MARKPSFIRTPGRTSPDEGRGSQKETALQQGAQCQGKAQFRGAGVAINRTFEARMRQLHITGQRFPQAKPATPNALKNRPSLPLDESQIPNPTADEVVVIQPWFNLLAAAIWQSERDRGSIQTSLQDSREEVHWSQSRMSNELSVLRTPRTLSRCLPRSPCDSRLDSASTETRPPSSQVPLLPRPRRLEQEGALGALEATVWPAGSARWRRLELVKTSPSPPSPGPGRPAQRNRDPRSSDAFLGPVDCESDGEYEPFAARASNKPRSAGAARCWWQL